MAVAIELTIQVLEMIAQAAPVGTNVGLLRLLWAMVSGSFLSSRGGIFPALKESGFTKEESYRTWSAMKEGAWTIEKLLAVWNRYVLRAGEWQERSYEGYRPAAVDWTAFWRPQLKGWPGRFFHRLANRTLCGVGFGMIVGVGDVGDQRLPLLRKLVRIEGKDMSEAGLKQKTLRWLARHLDEDEIAVVDAGVSVSSLQNAGVPRWLVRMARNCTARRNYLPSYLRGRPNQYGERVRPLARQHMGKTIAASKPDCQQVFNYQGREIQVQAWHNLVRSDLKVGETQSTFSIWVFFDPLYLTPLVVAGNVPLSPFSIFCLYLDRWPVEQVPLAAKQMLGLHRQFVFSSKSNQRLPELAMLAGNVLTYLAAVLPPMPTGFWDKHPKKHQAVCAGSWRKSIFPLSLPSMGNFAKNARSLTTFPRAFWPIVAKKGPPDLASTRFPPLSLSSC